MKYVPPSTEKTSFNCPHCEVLTSQSWFEIAAAPLNKGQSPSAESIGEPVAIRPWRVHAERRVDHIWLSACRECSKVTVWFHDQIIHPLRGEAPPANPDLSEDIRRDYDEAGLILGHSPRGAAALLRLAIEKLCKKLCKERGMSVSGKNLNNMIGVLVEQGLPQWVKEALDSIRVIGNHAIHPPGVLDIRDDRATAESLFRLLNFIAEKMLSEPKYIKEIHKGLPEGALEGIENRDKKSRPTDGEQSPDSPEPPTP